jgi:hypothetical protein
MESQKKVADASEQPFVTTLKPTKAEYQRADYEREVANMEVSSSEAVAGRWYISEKWGHVLCCGTTDITECIPAFAVRDDAGRTLMKYIHDSNLKETPFQSW